MTLYKIDENGTALAARRHVAAALTEKAIAALRKAPSLDAPHFELMQHLYDSGIGVCPGSGMPVFDPSACSPELRRAIWRAYVNVANTVNTTWGGDDTAADLQELRTLILETYTEGS